MCESNHAYHARFIPFGPESGKISPMTTDELLFELRRFSEEHPQGWGHDEWTGLLDQLAVNGHDVSDHDGIGRSLERERLVHTLQRMEVRGLGPKRVDAIADRFGTLWNLMNASEEDIAGIPSVPRPLAVQILDTLQ